MTLWQWIAIFFYVLKDQCWGHAWSFKPIFLAEDVFLSPREHQDKKDVFFFSILTKPSLFIQPCECRVCSGETFTCQSVHNNKIFKRELMLEQDDGLLHGRTNDTFKKQTREQEMYLLRQPVKTSIQKNHKSPTKSLQVVLSRLTHSGFLHLYSKSDV